MVNAFNYLNYLNARNKTIIAFLVDTGSRNFETCSILTSNIKDNYFLSNTGLPLTVETIERVVKTAGEIAGVRKEIRCSPHTIRHYFAQKQLRIV